MHFNKVYLFFLHLKLNNNSLSLWHICKASSFLAEEKYVFYYIWWHITPSAFHPERILYLEGQSCCRTYVNLAVWPVSQRRYSEEEISMLTTSRKKSGQHIQEPVWNLPTGIKTMFLLCICIGTTDSQLSSRWTVARSSELKFNHSEATCLFVFNSLHTRLVDFIQPRRTVYFVRTAFLLQPLKALTMFLLDYIFLLILILHLKQL